MAYAPCQTLNVKLKYVLRSFCFPLQEYLAECQVSSNVAISLFHINISQQTSILCYFFSFCSSVHIRFRFCCFPQSAFRIGDQYALCSLCMCLQTPPNFFLKARFSFQLYLRFSFFFFQRFSFTPSLKRICISA